MSGGGAPDIHRVRTEAETLGCLPVLRQLRPGLDAATFPGRVRALEEGHGYLLAALWEDGEARAVAGFRIAENLAWGRFLYVDDLVTDAHHRGLGLGGELLSWLIERAREAGCDEVHLDSGVDRMDAHRFYEGHGLAFASHHFRLRLEAP